MKKNVYMVQANHSFGNNVYIPYSVGCLAAYAWSKDIIKDNYNLAGFIFMKEDIDSAIEKFDNPYIVAFSCYVWNYEYNLLFAEKVRKKFPDCRIIFGGHNVKMDSCEQLDEYPAIDFLLHDEGEVPFYSLLAALVTGEDLGNVSNLSYRDEKGVAHKTENVIPGDIKDFPSPYLMGLFDDIVDDKKFNFNLTMETSRGCPYHCAFCDWSSIKTKMRQFPLERIQAEIDWMAKHEIEYLFVTDSNFGIYERDLEIAKMFVDSKKRTGYPDKIKVDFAKYSDDRVFEINKLFNENGMSKGASLSVQSMSPVVLENIGRKNLTMEKFSKLMVKYHAENIPTYSEVILGLPGETYDSFCDGIGELLDNGQHMSVHIFKCEVLMNSPLGQKDYQEKHGIRTVETYLRKEHAAPDAADALEKSTVIIGSATMSTEDWVKTNIFSYVIQCFHCLGLLQFFSIYAHYENNIPYSEFYKKFVDWIYENPQTIVGSFFEFTKKQLELFAEGVRYKLYINEKFGDIIWPYEEGAFLEIITQREKFYEEIKPFLTQFVDDEMYEELLKYQMGLVCYPNKEALSIDLKYDFYNFFRKIYINEYEPIVKVNNTIHINDSKMDYNWEDYAKYVIWYGRKGGRSMYIDIDVDYK